MKLTITIDSNGDPDINRQELQRLAIVAVHQAMDPVMHRTHPAIADGATHPVISYKGEQVGSWHISFDKNSGNKCSLCDEPTEPDVTYCAGCIEKDLVEECYRCGGCLVPVEA